MQLTIGHLYPDLLNIYGDRGNIICLVNRCRWRGIKVKVINISIGDLLKPKTHDLFFGGGGQDRQQMIVAKDLQTKAKVLREEANRGVPMLTVCGTYQLFGQYFKAEDATVIPGISIFDAYTIASPQRKIGNIVVEMSQTIINHTAYTSNPNLVGFENHWGSTYINKNSKLEIRNSKFSTFPLGKVIKGFGNNGKDKTEGAIYNNVFGSYLHGSLLPKNPHFADLLIRLALEMKYKTSIALKSLNDSLEWQAHTAATARAYKTG
jgi:hypothetical protein